ncbi:MAG TPA: cyanophycin synthetase [Solirubrobacterales bacterium]|nr:cyanophycin synthetase [Solirubrobacterales bacterium]
MDRPDGSGREAEQPSPDDYLDSLEPIGWRLGLERMHKLTTALGLPQHRFGSIHVVGTNGKSSVTRMTAALLEAHGVAAGACLSPHTARWSERTLVHGEEVDAERWAAAVAAVARAAEGVNRTLDEGETVTQFEAATAATFVALANARVKAAAIEAGLGGRLDATNTIPSRVTVLTSVGLDHTEWLGETELEIAAEKLAVLRDQTTLVLGRLSPEVAELAARTAAERGARLVQAPEDPGAEIEMRAPGRFQRRNFALAISAAEAFLGELDPAAVAAVAASVTVPGRLEQVAAEPPTYLDAAHNPDGFAALAEALPAVVGERRLVACLAILADKDVEAMIAELAPVLDRAVCTEIPPAALEGHGRPGARTRPAAELAAACAAAGLSAEVEPEFKAALERGRALAAESPAGALLVAGSHYAIGPARVILAVAGT